MKTNPNSPMYPLPLTRNGTIMPENKFLDEYYAVGLKKREYFAGLAMQGLLANNYIIEQYKKEYIAELAIEQADALINELNKEEKNENHIHQP